MKILLYGSSQAQHIKTLFTNAGITCITLSKNKNKVIRRIQFIYKILTAKIVYRVGGCDVLEDRVLHFASKCRKKVVIHWIGTDVLNIIESYRNQPRSINKNCINLAGSALLCEELKTIGIDAFEIPIVPQNLVFQPLPTPLDHAVLCYIPDDKEDFYGLDLTVWVAKHFPDVIFYIVANCGNGRQDDSNIKYLGYVDSNKMKELYGESTILFRYPKHDGLSMMLLEALGLGRIVIYRYKFPYVKTPKEDDRDSILQMFSEVLREEPSVNVEGSRFVNCNYSAQKQIERYMNVGIL